MKLHQGDAVDWLRTLPDNRVDFGIPDVLSVKRVHRGYPTEKPVELFEALIEQSTQPGDVVADPFFGSGASLVAAKRLSRQAWGNDISPDAHNHLNGRTNEWQHANS